jgi:hypothetical protein
MAASSHDSNSGVTGPEIHSPKRKVRLKPPTVGTRRPTTRPTYRLNELLFGVGEGGLQPLDPRRRSGWVGL